MAVKNITGVSILVAFILAMASCSASNQIGSRPDVQPSSAILAGSPHLDEKRLNELIQREMSSRRVPGAAVVVVKGDRIIYQHTAGIADLTTRSPITMSTLMPLASATKFLSGLAFLSAAEDGLLDLSAPIEQVFVDAPPTWHGTPVWRLLNHTAGIPMIVSRDGFNAMTDEERARLTHRQVFDMIRNDPLDFTPGSRTRYQQSGFSVLAMILREKTGQTWDELLRLHVLTPARMTNTRYGDSLVEHPTAYELKDNELKEREYFYPTVLSMGAGYNTSAGDLAALFRALNRGEVVSNEFLLKEIFVPERIEPRGKSDGAGEGYGLATIVERHGDAVTIGHSGGGSIADIRYSPKEKIGIAVISNQMGSGFSSVVTGEIARQLFISPTEHSNL